MRKHFRRYVLGALAVGTIAGGAAAALPGAQPGWRPTTFGLDRTPAQLLPATVSGADPVRVVTTTLRNGRPVASVRTATDMATAEALVTRGQKTANALGVQIDHRVHALDAPGGTDPMRAQQWDFATMHVTDAWARSTGAGVIVAVIDTGVDGTHPDLAGQVLAGFDEINQTPAGNTDPNGHGTHVAGTIAAVTGDGLGVSAIAPDTRIMPIRVLGADGSGYMSDAANGIVYAADHGARVVNMSLGSNEQDPAVTDAVAYARSRGVVVVAAAGNDGQKGSPASYPGADPGVLAVAATDSADNVAGYSTRGGYVDVAAPGSAILSTFPYARNSTGYQILYGTSMATPHVAAVAALLEAYDPALSPDQIENALESSAVDLGAPGVDNDSGHGRIDAAAALAAVTPATTAPATTGPAVEPTSADPTTTATADPTVEPTSADPAGTDPAGTDPAGTDPATSPSDDPTTDPTTEPTTSPTTDPTTGPTTEPTASPRAPVTAEVRLNATARLIRYGSSPTVTFLVGAAGRPLPGQPVYVCVAIGGTPYRCTDAATDDNGVVAWTQRATAPFRIHLLVPATDRTTAVTSATANYRVQAVVTATRAGTRSLTVALGGVDRQTVAVQRLDGTRWVTARTVKAAARTTVTGLTAAKSYRVVVPNSVTFTGVTSATVQL